jgi:hypothetical protein
MLRNSYTDLTRLKAVLDVVDVEADHGYLILTSNETSTPFVEVEPHVFEEVGGTERVVFAEDKKGKVTHPFLGYEPSTALEKLAWQETPRFQLRLLAACNIVFITAVCGWPLVLLANRKMQPRGVRSNSSRLCSWIGWLACLSGTAFILLAIDVLENSDEIVFGIDPFIDRTLLLPQLSVVLFSAMLVCGLFAWKNWYWRLSGRLHYTLSCCAGAGYLWLLNHWNVLRFGW